MPNEKSPIAYSYAANPEIVAAWKQAGDLITAFGRLVEHGRDLTQEQLEQWLSQYNDAGGLIRNLYYNTLKHIGAYPK